MTIINFTGFETGDFAEAYLYSGNVAVQTTNKNKGSYSLQVSTVGGNDYYCLGQYDATGIPSLLSLSTAYVQFYIKVTSMPDAMEQIFSFEDASATIMGSLRLDPDGYLHMMDADNNELFQATDVLAINTYYRIRLKVDNSNACATQLLVNDEAWGYADSIKYGEGTISLISFGTRQSANAGTYIVYFDDITIDDSSIGPNTNLAYFCKILMPNAAGGTAGWTGGTGSTFAVVDEIPTNDDTDYIKNTGSSTSTFNVTNLKGLSDPNSAFVLKSWGRFRSDNSLISLLVDLRVVSGATTNTTTAVNPSTSYLNRFKLYLTNPNGSVAWTSTSVNAVQVGVGNSTKNTAARCTTLGILILGSNATTVIVPNTTPMLAAMGVGGPSTGGAIA